MIFYASYNFCMILTTLNQRSFIFYLLILFFVDEIKDFTVKTLRYMICYHQKINSLWFSLAHIIFRKYIQYQKRKQTW